MADLLLFENGDGGDLKLRKSDLYTTNGYENMPYLALFGDDEDWWGNALFSDLDVSALMLSKTTKVLESVALNSAGRIKIEAAIIEDLAFINQNVPDTIIDVKVVVTSDDRLDITIVINGDIFSFYWNPIKKELDSTGIYHGTGIFTDEFTNEFT